MTSLWKLPQPWTLSTRPPLLGNPQNGFRKLPQAAAVLVRKGTFLFRVDNCWNPDLTGRQSESTIPALMLRLSLNIANRSGDTKKPAMVLNPPWRA